MKNDEWQALVSVCLFTRPFTQNTITQSNNVGAITQSNNVGAVTGTKALLRSQA